MTMLAGRYELGPQIERGGMAVVYRATDTLLNRSVAVKVLSGQPAQDASFVRRFEREARNAARLSHPNVVAVFDAGSDGDTHFMVMELVEGTTLAELIRDEAPLEADRAAAIAAGIAEGLRAAHDVGIVHRDVKPANILLTPAGTVKVADFGIARAADSASITQTGTLLGTAAYVSPEQALGLPATARSDVYALGCVLFEMLTARAPFPADTPVATLQRHIEDPVPSPASLVLVPAALDRLVVACLAKDPEARPQTAGELRDALRAATRTPARPDATAILEPTAGGTVPIPRRGPTAEAEPPWWTRPGAVLVGGLLVVALLVALVVTVSGGETPADADRASRRSPAAPTAAATPTAEPTDQPTADPTTGEPHSVDEAYALLVAEIERQAAAGGMQEKPAEDLRHRAEDIGEKLAGGEYAEVAKKIAEFDVKTREFVDKGEMSAEAGAALNVSLRGLVAAIILVLDDAG